MANAYSLKNDYGNIQKPANLNLITSVLSAKQTKHDKNLAQIEQMKQEYGGIDFKKKGVDEKFQSELQTLVDDVNSSGQVDWSNNNVARKIKGHISGVLDEEFIHYMQEDQKIEAFQKRMNEIQDTEEYHQKNEAFAMYEANVNEYINGDAESVGNFNYTPYTDVGKEVRDVSNNLTKYVDDIKVEKINGQTKITRYSEELKPQEVKDIVFSQLSDRAKEQIKINGWSKYVASGNEGLLNQSYGQYTQSKIEEIDNDIGQIELAIENTPKERKKHLEALKTRKESLEQSKQSVFNLAQDDSKRALTQKARILEQESLLGNLSRIYSEDRTDINKLEIDTVSGTVVSDSKRLANMFTEDGLPAITEVKNAADLGDDEFDPLHQTMSKSKANVEKVKTGVLSIFNNLSEEKQEKFNKGFKNSDSDNKVEYLFKEFDKLAKSNSNIIKGSDMASIRIANAKANAQNNLVNKGLIEGAKAEEGRIGKDIFEGLQSNLDYKITTSEGETITAKEALKNIDNFEDFKDSDYYKPILASIYAKEIEQITGTGLADIMKEATVNSLATSSSVFTALSGLALKYSESIEGKEDKQKVVTYTERLKSLIGKDDIKKFLEDSKSNNLSNMEWSSADYISAMKGAPVGWITNALTTTKAEILESIDHENIRENSKKWLKENMPDQFRNKTVTLNPGHRLHESARNLAYKYIQGYDEKENKDGQADMQAITRDGNDDKVPISITEVSPQAVKLTLTTGEKDDDGNTIYKSRTILRKDMTDVLKEAIDFSGSKNTFNNKTFPEGVSNSNVFTPSAQNIERRKDIERVFGREFAAIYTKETLTRQKFKGYSDIIGSQRAPNYIGEIVKKGYDDDAFVLEAKKIDGEVYPVLSHKNSDFEYKSTVPIKEQDLTNFYRQVHLTPHIYLDKYIDSMLKDFEKGDDEKLKEFKNIYE